MKQIRTRLTYANVMSTIAVFLVVGGASAFAAGQLAKNSVGTKQLKKNAVTTAKIKKEAVNGAKIKNGSVSSGKLAAGAVSSDKIADGAIANGKLANDAVNTAKIADNAVSTAKVADNAINSAKIADNAVNTGEIANSAVTAAKLAPSERSEAFQTWEEGLLNTEMATGLLSSYASGTLAVQTTLPAGNYVVTASTELIQSTITEERSAICRLFDDGDELGEGASMIGKVIIVTQGTISITGISNGGTLSLRCRASGDKVFSFDRKITAIKVGSVS